jgi:hypothetical protein
MSSEIYERLNGPCRRFGLVFHCFGSELRNFPFRTNRIVSETLEWLVGAHLAMWLAFSQHFRVGPHLGGIGRDSRLNVCIRKYTE